jgi:hypothetical protein
MKKLRERREERGKEGIEREERGKEGIEKGENYRIKQRIEK